MVKEKNRLVIKKKDATQKEVSAFTRQNVTLQNLHCHKLLSFPMLTGQLSFVDPSLV